MHDSLGLGCMAGGSGCPTIASAAKLRYQPLQANRPGQACPAWHARLHCVSFRPHASGAPQNNHARVIAEYARTVRQSGPRGQ